MPQTNPPKHEIGILVLGSYSVGIHSLCEVFCNSKFETRRLYDPTGEQGYRKRISISTSLPTPKAPNSQPNASPNTNTKKPKPKSKTIYPQSNPTSTIKINLHPITNETPKGDLYMLELEPVTWSPGTPYILAILSWIKRNLPKQDHDPNVCMGILLAYSICNRDSFFEIRGLMERMERLMEEGPNHVESQGRSGEVGANGGKEGNVFWRRVVMLVGTKADSLGKREVRTDEGPEMARQLGIRWGGEVSAKLGWGVEDAVLGVVREVLGARGVEVKDAGKLEGVGKKEEMEVGNEKSKGALKRIMEWFLKH